MKRRLSDSTPEKRIKLETMISVPFSILEDRITVWSLGKKGEEQYVANGTLYPFLNGYHIERIGKEILVCTCTKGEQGQVFTIEIRNLKRELIMTYRGSNPSETSRNLKMDGFELFGFNCEMIQELIGNVPDRKVFWSPDTKSINRDVICPECGRIFTKYQILFHFDQKHQKDKKRLIKIINGNNK
jgi:hypothetical protein